MDRNGNACGEKPSVARRISRIEIMTIFFAMRSIRKYIVAMALAMASASSFAGVFISVGIAPPALPVYVQPICPGDGYLWNPGYWAYGDAGYYWVPGVWVQPPMVGVLWTPGYWGWGGSAFLFHAGYWGPHVGFYGGINYGFGYGGVGFLGGRWDGGHFAYNTAVMNVNRTVIHNTYVENVHVNVNPAFAHTSFNGGTGGIQVHATAQEAAYGRETHVPPTAAQQSHVQMAGNDRANFASANGGHPAHVTAVTVNNYRSTTVNNNSTHVNNSTNVNNSTHVNQTNVHNGATNTAVHNGSTTNVANGNHDTAGTNNHPAATTPAAHPQVQAHPQPQAHPAPHPEGGGEKPR
jgi:hypothetical protein